MLLLKYCISNRNIFLLFCHCFNNFCSQIWSMLLDHWM